MSPSTLKEKLESLSPDTRAQVTDLTGTEDHYEVIVVSPAFQGKSMIERHRLVFSMVQSEISTGEVHALTIRALTPDQEASLVKSRY